MQPQKFPDVPVSLEENTEVPDTTSFIRMETRADGDHGEGLLPPVGSLDILPECVFQLSLNLITFFCLRGVFY